MTRTRNVLRTPRANRVAALALLALAIMALLALIAVPTYFAHVHYDSANAKTARLLGAYTALNQTRPKLLQSVEYLRGKDAGKFYLKGATPALASVELQDTIKSMIEANGGRFISSQAGSNKEDSGYRQVATKVQMMVNIQILRRVLYALESRQPYLFIDSLRVQSQVPAGFKPAPGVEPDLFVEFDASGYSPMPGYAVDGSAETKGKI